MKKKSKVLILSLGRSGSLPEYAIDMAHHFKTIDYDIITSKYRLTTKKVAHNIELKTYTNKSSFIINTLIYFPIKFISLIPKLCTNYHTLYLPYKHFWDIPFIVLFKILNRKVIFTIHDGVLHKGEKNWYTQFLNTIRIKAASEFIFLTEFVKNKVYNTYNLKKLFQIIPHPIIENSYLKPSKNIKPSKNLLFLGRIDKYKGIELLMSTIEGIEQYIDSLTIAGSSLYKVNYIKHPKIKIIDKYLTDKDIGNLLNWADILILPYTEATQSGVITLGINAELPMICTDVGGFKEQLSNDEAFWCEPNEESIKNTIIEAFSNRKKCQEIKEKIRTKKAMLSWGTVAGQVEQILKNTT